ncbi:hypothetical protein AB0P21_31160 [Kribbella sp. NPDC056861]|uniref:hypothetical protein n=1 Tax=Kribbella sp. NPDC056861 TaxID=3154857 RepID=UPI003433FD23
MKFRVFAVGATAAVALLGLQPGPASAQTTTKTYQVAFVGTADQVQDPTNVSGTIDSKFAGTCRQTGTGTVTQEPNGGIHSLLIVDWKCKDGTIKVRSEGSIPPGGTEIVNGQWSVLPGSTGRYTGATGGGGHDCLGGGHGGSAVTGVVHWEGQITLRKTHL